MSSASFTQHPGSEQQATRLPRLLYIGDVPVESSYHGSALLYRLLQDYPPDRLLVVEAGASDSLPERRLPGVEYRSFKPMLQRWRRTRFSRWVSSWLAFSPALGTRRLRRSFNGFEAEAVLTVAHGFSWLAAARLAKRANLPLHLVVHDDWSSDTHLVPGLSKWKDRQFAKFYSQATSRLCVSPYMEEIYRRDYGVAGQVLYPGRAKHSPTFDGPPVTYTRDTGPLTAAYAGNLFNDYSKMLLEFAIRLEKSGSRLLLFGPQTAEDLLRCGLNRVNIFPQGLVSSGELISRLRKEADLVLVPMSFYQGAFRRTVEVSFPSKLTDYTAAGLPLLIWGPGYCSAVRWAVQYAPVAEVVTSQNGDGLDAAFHRLEDAGYRQRLGLAAMELGNRFFSYDVLKAQLYATLAGNGRC